MEELTPISTVLGRTSSDQPDSESRTIDEVTVTPSEAKKRRLKFRRDPPENEICQYCGKEIEPKGIVFGDMVYLWQPFAPRCTCPEAKAYWEDYDKQQKEKEEREKELERQRVLKERIQRLLHDSGIKKRFLQRTFENFRCDTKDRAACYKVAKSYADEWQFHKSNGDGLYIEGTNGTGKTHLAAAIALQLIGEGIPVICKTSTDMLNDIKRAFDDPRVTETQVLDVYEKVDLLIVDDLGKEQCSDWSMSTLYNIFNARYEDMKPIIITTNYGAKDLISALTPKGYDNTKIIAIISRLRETSMVLSMVWRDIRGDKI